MTAINPTLRLAANLKWLFTERPFPERFDAAAAAGFTGVEYSSPYDYPAARVRSWLDEAGLCQVLINTPADAADPFTRLGLACIPGREGEFRSGVSRALEYADILGSSFVHVLGGIRSSGTQGGDHAFATYQDNIAWAAEEASSTSVRLLLEVINQRDAPGFILESVEQAADVAAGVATSNVGLLFDVYHGQVGQGDITRRLERLAPVIEHIQIADVPYRTEPGTGELAWDHIFAVLRRLGYDGWIGCEYAPAVGTELGLRWRDAFALNL